MNNGHLDICFWNKCNNHCLMCTNPAVFWEGMDYTYAFLCNRLSKYKGKIKSLCVTGGEPTMHPDFLSLLDFIKSELPEVGVNLLTNGRMFCYANFTRKCCELENINFAVSLHGYDAQTHDSITLVKGSFEQACRGIKNILRYKKPGQGLEIRVVVTKLNCRFIDKILEFIRVAQRGIDRVILVFMEIEGTAQKNIKRVGLTYSGFKSQLALIKKMIPAFKSFRLYHFPLCVVASQLWEYVWVTLPEDEVTFLAQCKSCWCRALCLGVHKGYARAYGNKEFSAPRKVELVKTGNPNHPIGDVLN